MKNITLLLVLFLAFIACEKRQNNRTENKLEGSWILVKSEYGDSEADISEREQILTFYDNAEEYTNKDGFHNGSMFFKYTDFSFELTFLYQVVNKGDDLLMLIEFNSPSNESEEVFGFSLNNPTIGKLTGNRFRMEGKNADGLTSIFTYERIKQ